jgi:hypothetical protein
MISTTPTYFAYMPFLPIARKLYGNVTEKRPMHFQKYLPHF